MRIKPNESQDEWAERVRLFELDHAKKQMAKGIPVDEVLEWMSKRINQKLMHPVLAAIRTTPQVFDLEASKKAYKKAYLDKNGPKADHLTDD